MEKKSNIYKKKRCQIRCLNDNKLLFKQINGIIEIKCSRCKKIHILDVNKKE